MELRTLKTTQKKAYILKGRNAWFYNNTNYENIPDKWKGYWINDYKYLEELKPYIILNEQKIYLQTHYSHTDYDGVTSTTTFLINDLKIVLKNWFVNKKDLMIINIEIETEKGLIRQKFVL